MPCVQLAVVENRDRAQNLIGSFELFVLKFVLKHPRFGICCDPSTNSRVDLAPALSTQCRSLSAIMPSLDAAD
ncbi:hypothetical protein [Ferrimicrobium sp.]|uniref:hypothetical protein n=1 Tax=Ferrimicrobium sp. TaxID=2926050 RepID=UPI002601FF41|nr:hypothetical protein [Ferrimicrobium sp.]